MVELTQADRDGIISMLERGFSYGQIAQEQGISRSTVAGIAYRRNIAKTQTELVEARARIAVLEEALKTTRDFCQNAARCHNLTKETRND